MAVIYRPPPSLLAREIPERFTHLKVHLLLELAVAVTTNAVFLFCLRCTFTNHNTEYIMLSVPPIYDT